MSQSTPDGVETLAITDHRGLPGHLSPNWLDWQQHPICGTSWTGYPTPCRTLPPQGGGCDILLVVTTGCATCWGVLSPYFTEKTLKVQGRAWKTLQLTAPMVLLTVKLNCAHTMKCASLYRASPTILPYFHPSSATICGTGEFPKWKMPFVS